MEAYKANTVDSRFSEGIFSEEFWFGEVSPVDQKLYTIGSLL